MNILVLYGTLGYPVRSTVWNHLYCYQKYSNCRVFYVNISLRALGALLSMVRFDLIIYHDLCMGLSQRSTESAYLRAVKKMRRTSNMHCPKVFLPQDEFQNTNRLVRFINDFKINRVLSVAPETEWKKIYQGVDFSTVCFERILTGYIEDDLVDNVKKMGQADIDRNIAVGSRVAPQRFYLGRLGNQKSLIGEVFDRKLAGKNLRTSISSRPEDTIFGDNWYKFLLQCKYILGAEGGSSILDADGSVYRCVQSLVQKEPDISFEEAERLCFSGRDREYFLTALSPRHLEACVTKTCQILVEGTYNEILKPDIHYIAVREDFSNVDEIIGEIETDQKRHIIIENAYRDVVLSKKYHYSNFVKSILKYAIPPEGSNLLLDAVCHAIWAYNIFAEFISWKILQGKYIVKKILPIGIINRLKYLLQI